MDEEKLLGDKVEEVLQKVGADKVAKKVEKVTKRPCGCQKRKNKLNNLHRRMIGQPTRKNYNHGRKR